MPFYLLLGRYLPSVSAREDSVPSSSLDSGRWIVGGITALGEGNPVSGSTEEEEDEEEEEGNSRDIFAPDEGSEPEAAEGCGGSWWFAGLTDSSGLVRINCSCIFKWKQRICILPGLGSILDTASKILKYAAIFSICTVSKIHFTL